MTVLAVLALFSQPRSGFDQSPVPGFAYCGAGDSVMLTGTALPCSSVMQVVDEFERRYASGQGRRVFVVRGFRCSAEGEGLVLCTTPSTQLTFTRAHD